MSLINFDLNIRLFQPQDLQQIAQLFHDTVRNINIKDYSLAQVTAWSPDDIYFRDWVSICSNRFTYVAEQNSKIVGFGELKSDGYIDCFYVHYQYQSLGVGTQIYRAIEHQAIHLNLSCLSVEASITAKPFFLRQGFINFQKQEVFCRGEKFTNYLMKKTLI